MIAELNMGLTMGYTKKWYEENKDSIAARRRKRYTDDPEYRKAVLSQSQQYRERQRKERAQFLENPSIVIKGNTVAAMTVEQLEEATGIDKTRLKYLQKAGYIPAATVTRPVRLYTHNQAELIKELEAFLTEHSQYLRATRTPEGQQAQALLTPLKDKITMQWEN